MSSNSYDAVIVGGGSAGAALAARLSENSQRRVLLLEAGSAYPATGHPPEVANSSLLGAYTSHDWGYVSEPGFIGHPVAAYRGKVLGGGIVLYLPQERQSLFKSHRQNRWLTEQLRGRK
jgi:choline dehydrogenase